MHLYAMVLSNQHQKIVLYLKPKTCKGWDLDSELEKLSHAILHILLTADGGVGSRGWGGGLCQAAVCI